MSRFGVKNDFSLFFCNELQTPVEAGVIRVLCRVLSKRTREWICCQYNSCKKSMSHDPIFPITKAKNDIDKNKKRRTKNNDKTQKKPKNKEKIIDKHQIYNTKSSSSMMMTVTMEFVPQCDFCGCAACPSISGELACDASLRERFEFEKILAQRGNVQAQVQKPSFRPVEKEHEVPYCEYLCFCVLIMLIMK